VQRGNPDDEEKPQNASLLKGMDPKNVDLATALKLLSLPRNLGEHPQFGQPVMAFNGRFGPYVKCGDETRSLPADVSPLDVTLDQAVALLAQPKQHGRGRAAAKREPLKVFEASPVTGEKVQLLDGRYGPYVTDGTTNASLPKGTAPEELTLSEALSLLAARAAAGPPKRRGAKRKTAKASAAPKKSATKRRPKAAAKSTKAKTSRS
jgi:DNA topoisomerase I